MRRLTARRNAGSGWRRRAQLCALLALVTVSCSSSDDRTADGSTRTTAVEQVAPGGSLVYASVLKLTGFNQLAPTSASLLLSGIMHHVWPSAFAPGADGQPLLNSDLLLSAEQTSSDPQTVVYRINPEATWSDGDPLDANDFVYLWKTAYTPGAKDIDGSPIAATTASAQGVIASVTASEDATTATVVFSRSYPDWKALFSNLVPAHIAERVGWNRGFDTFDPDVIVSGGPFRIDAYNPDKDLTLVRNDRYWGAKPHLDSIVVRLLPDPGQVLAALKNREIDLTELISPDIDTLAQVNATPGLSSIVAPLERYERLYFSFRNPLLQIPEVRRAAALAIDRRAIMARRNGQLDPDLQLVNNRLYVPIDKDYRDTTGGGYDRADPAGARKLLESAGFTRGDDGIFERNGSRLSFRMPTAPLASPSAELVQAHLREAGIDVQVEASPTALDSLRSGDFDVIISSRPTSKIARSLVASSEFLTDAGFNHGKYSNPTVDDLLRQANSELNEARRASLYHRADEVMWEDLPTLPLQQVVGVAVHRDSFTNIELGASGGTFASAHQWAITSGKRD